MVDWTNGCIRRTKLNCSGDGFLKLTGVKLPETRNKSWFNVTMTLDECKEACIRNCSCTAYANLDVRNGGSGCLVWYAELGLDCLNCLSPTHMNSDKEDLELPLFDLTSVAFATNNFSQNNILGQGGFGTVYKGTLRDGVEVAVKKLSSDSKQGVDEFKNEAINIAKLQHRNLVRLLGCCVQRGQRMLLYEFMPNTSLDVFIFDKTKSHLLDWPKRYNIIKGIARGLLYLHQDSRLRIIHRDLKASNVLLDNDMNPKISDFGLARTFVGNAIQGNTRNVVGTYGYMSPEYTIDGIYSIKSDVFSFGVMVLEVVSGERNRGFNRPDHQLNLLGHAWTLQREDKVVELVDETMRETYEQCQVLRLIHIGLLCVQKSPEDRPTMSTVMHMLDGEGDLAEPKQPGFFTERDLSEDQSSSSSGNRKPCTNASMTLTQLLARSGDTITPALPLHDGDTIISADGTYQMGFFSPGSSTKNRYLGIWYRDIPDLTIVWVANREKPIPPPNVGVLHLTSNGTLLLLDRVNGTRIWSTTTLSALSGINSAVVAQLLNSGNLVVKRQQKDENDDDVDNTLWQSFDYMGDTLLSGMKLGRNMVTGLNRMMRSWKSPEDPSPGNFTYGMEIEGYPEIVQRQNSMVRFRTGPWTGLSFSGTPYLKPNILYTFEFVFNKQEAYYSYHLRNSSALSRVVITPAGLVQRYTWLGGKQGWMVYLSAQTDNCDRYAVCGAYGICDIVSSPSCSCLEGFVPKVPKEWDMVDWRNGCVRRTELNCSGDGFLKLTGVKVPETRNKLSWFNVTMSLDDCRDACIRNCSCTAYANLDVRNGGSGCLLWYDELLDIRKLYENGEILYVRMAASDIGMLMYYVCSHISSDKQDIELPLFDFTTIASATNNFSSNNVLGHGGFGTVYKGTLRDGVEIAVKRLSSSSKQGADEFKNEVINIAKLQHRNLVKLLGCCVQHGERILLYEFMPNRSLDFFIFDKSRSHLLDWPKRYNIIKGIARGLLYLHQDSRLRIIHRDLKLAMCC
ncbi:G-type lectin S-receptor-like serine/threonine-protein kinase At4g27290 [Linum grandiflorum]